MSNNYSRILVEEENTGGHTRKMELSLTAFSGKNHHTQMNVKTISDIYGKSSVAFILLSDKEIDLLIAALLERRLGKISSGGNEQPIFYSHNK